MSIKQKSVVSPKSRALARAIADTFEKTFYATSNNPELRESMEERQRVFELAFIAGYDAHEERTRGLVEALRPFADTWANATRALKGDLEYDLKDFEDERLAYEALKEYEEPTQAKGEVRE